jgi:hypothetical protein
LSKPGVSLLVPVFNRKDLLRECLDSALAQTDEDLEVVVVDGASTDGTWDVCREYERADVRVRAIREEANRGPVAGWWRCLQEADGIYGTFLWSDDLLRPTFIERTRPFLQDPEVAFAYTAAEIGSALGEGSVYFAQTTGLVSSESFILGSLTAPQNYPVSPACALFRLDDIRKSFTMKLPTFPPFDLTKNGAGTDVLMYLLTAAVRPLVAHIADPLAFFRAHPGSITIGGQEGRVALGYAVTKAWFAASRGRRDISARVLARQYLADMRRSRRPLAVKTTLGRYGNLVTAPQLIAALGPELVRWGTARLSGKRVRP